MSGSSKETLLYWCDRLNIKVSKRLNRQQIAKTIFNTFKNNEKGVKMNKEAIKKYRIEFNRWLNGGKLLYKYNGQNKDENGWQDVPAQGCWTTSDPQLIVINDEYVELRKAFAEGKEIELNNTGSAICPDWGTANPNKIPFETYPVYMYHIKPEEPNVKPGDWVRIKQLGYGEVLIDQVVEVSDSCVLFKNGMCNIDLVELWKPEVGEWCWFWDDDEIDVAIFGEFLAFTENGYNMKPVECINMPSFFHHCEPFIYDELPTHLKDRRR